LGAVDQVGAADGSRRRTAAASTRAGSVGSAGLLGAAGITAWAARRNRWMVDRFKVILQRLPSDGDPLLDAIVVSTAVSVFPSIAFDV
jgi:hypothetical protein